VPFLEKVTRGRNIHELLSAVKRPAILRLSRVRLVARTGHRFVRATVVAIDPRAARVITADGRQVGFDACIIAVGGVNDTFGVPGAERYAMPFKSVDHCEAIGRTLARLARRSGARSVVIVGGGLEGVEALGEVLGPSQLRGERALGPHDLDGRCHGAGPAARFGARRNTQAMGSGDGGVVEPNATRLHSPDRAARHSLRDSLVRLF